MTERFVQSGTDSPIEDRAEEIATQSAAHADPGGRVQGCTHRGRSIGNVASLVASLLFALPCLLGWSPASTAAPLVAGQYYDTARSGHGFDLQAVGDQWVLVLYTYESSGEPVWYLSTPAASIDGAIESSLQEYAFDGTPQASLRLVRDVGTFRLETQEDCVSGGRDGRRFSWNLLGESATWCMVSLLDKDAAVDDNLTGLWYGGSMDSGWGLSIDMAAAGSMPVESFLVFYYDGLGAARWAFGVANAGFDASADMFNARGYCRLCPPTTLDTAPAGSIRHRIEFDRGQIRGMVDLDLSYAFAPGGSWTRHGNFEAISDLQPRLIPFPDVLAADVAVAIKDVTLLPLTETGLSLPHQTVLLRDGAIVASGPHGSVAIPEDAWHVDARGMYLGPGYADMHTHITTSGQPAMDESGTLLIANGVTSVLNMGDGGTLNLPGLAARYRQGELIGPTVYLGKDAYGASDGRSARQTVTTRPQATSFAQLAQTEGYDFLKVYSGLQADVLDQFRIESQLRGLPIIGHIPRSVSMSQALDLGQRMIAHTAEVYFSYLGNAPNAALLPAAADLITSKGAYLTDTLTASESFSDMYGGNTANFNRYLQRDGVQFVTPAMISGWTGFFQSTSLQPPGSRPGQLDARLAFFKQMNRSFADAGVKMLVGTDSPSAHIGLVAGFSIHEDFRLLAETGITPARIYDFAAANAGDFIQQTLNPEQGFGRIEVGKRADLVLLDADPFLDVANMKRPAAVMARGRFWSRAYLDAQLEQIRLRNQPGAKASTIAPVDASGRHSAPKSGSSGAGMRPSWRPATH